MESAKSEELIPLDADTHSGDAGDAAMTIDFLDTIFPNTQREAPSEPSPRCFIHTWRLPAGCRKGGESLFVPYADRQRLVDDAVSKCGKYNIYFGLGLRSKDLGKVLRGDYKEVIAIPGLWAEVDVLGPGHKETNLPATKDDAVALVNSILPDKPPSMLIDSGGGIYAFWLFPTLWTFATEAERARAKTLLQRLFQRLQGEAGKQGWKLDNVCNLAEILRLPGTLNVKDPTNPRLAHIRESHPERRYTPEDLAAALPEERKIAPFRLHAEGRRRRSQGNENVATEGHEYPLADFRPIKSGCGFIRHCVDDAAELPEPEWHALMTILARCQNGKEIAHEVSSPYPGYEPEETTKKFEHALDGPGPHTCAYIEENLDDSYCGDCPSYGKIKSPISLGRMRQELSLAAQIAQMNEEFAVVRVGNQVLVLMETVDPATGRPDIALIKPKDMEIWMADRKVTTYVNGKPTVTSVAKAWLASPQRRRLDGIVFDPTGKTDPKKYYNLYQGLAYEPRSGDWSLFREHLRSVITAGNPDHYGYLLAWMAHIVQHPGGQRPGVAIVLKGGKGAGKGTFAAHFGALFGAHYLHLSQPGQLTGRFNAHLKNALVVFVDEGFWGGDKKAEGVLKSLITEETIMCEHKGRDAFSVMNHANFIMASNEDWVVPAGPEERRFYVQEVSDARTQDHQYFAAIDQQMRNGGREAMLYDLLRWDYSGINLWVAPRTKALLDQIERGMTTVQRFWYERLQDGLLPFRYVPPKELEEVRNEKPDLDPFRDWEKEVVIKDMYGYFLDYCALHGDRWKLMKEQFSKEIRKMSPGIKTIKPRESGKRVLCWVIPPLEECRAAFAKVLGLKPDWPEESAIEEPAKYDGPDETTARRQSKKTPGFVM